MKFFACFFYVCVIKFVKNPTKPLVAFFCLFLFGFWGGLGVLEGSFWGFLGVFGGFFGVFLVFFWGFFTRNRHKNEVISWYL